MLLLALACVDGKTPGTDVEDPDAVVTVDGEPLGELVDGYWVDAPWEDFDSAFEGDHVAQFVLTTYAGACQADLDYFDRLTAALDGAEDESSLYDAMDAAVAEYPDPTRWVEGWAVGAEVTGTYAVVYPVSGAGQAYTSARVRTDGGTGQELTTMALYEQGVLDLALSGDTLDLTIDALVDEDVIQLSATLGVCEGLLEARQSWSDAYEIWMRTHGSDC